MTTTTLTIGLTKSDRDSNYFPMSDGYRSGAPQRIVTVHVDDLRADDPEALAEAVFVATNAPMEVVQADSNALAVADALGDSQVAMRSLSVGDTVTIELPVGSRTYAVDHVGWQEVRDL